MNLHTIQFIFQCLLPAIICSIFLITFIAVDHTFPQKILKQFLWALIFAIMLMITDSADYYLQIEKGSISLRTVLNAFSYIFRISTVGLTVLINERYKKRHVIVIHCMMGINTILSLCSIWTGCIFSIGPDGEFYKGILYVVPFIISYSFTILLFISAHNQIRTNAGESAILFAIVLLGTLSNILELKFGFKLFLPVTFIISIVFYFLCLNVQLYRRDTLTNLLNRRSFYMDTKRHNHQNMVIISMDLNNLKKYNDEQGHQAGDKAIAVCVHHMIKAFRKIGKIYRTGGDEFVAVFREKSLDSVLGCLDMFKNSMAKTPYVVASGYAEYHPGDDFEKVLALCDERMYQDKSNLKKKSETEKR